VTLDGSLTRFSRSRHFWSRISQKQYVLGTKLLKKTIRKWYTIYRMIPSQWPWVTFDPISRSRHFSTLNISETTRDRAIVTIERQQEVICALSHGGISNDLDGPLTRFSRSRHRLSKKRCILWTMLFYRILVGNHTQSIE